LLGLYWKGGNRKGAFVGILAGFVIWIYTLLIPALMRAGLIETSGVVERIFSSKLLNPTALFGLEGMDRWSNSLFWGLAINLFLYVSISLLTRQSDEETRQSIIFVDAYSPEHFGVAEGAKTVDEIENMLAEYIGPEEAASEVRGFLRRNRLSREDLDQEWLIRLRSEAEMILSGALGPSMSKVVLQQRSILTLDEQIQLSDSIRRISSDLQLSRRELAEKNRQLALLKEFSENIIESIPLGVATLDQDLKVRILGVTKDDALNTEADIALRCIDSDLFKPEVRVGEMTCRKNKGVEAPLTLKVYLSELTGHQRGYVLVIEDITEKKRIEEELFRTSKHASIGRLAAGVSHEIGNPLASISSLVQELLAEDVSHFVSDSLVTINRHIDRIARIVRNLGDFARLYPRQKVPTNLGEILDNTIGLVKFDRNFKKIEIHTLVEEIPPLKIDPDQIQQVFLNLMLNARDAMPGGGQLSISIRGIDGYVETVFSDTGGGIDGEVRDKIFDPFFTTKGPSRGTGLGLSISYSIIRDHGGTIEVESEKGRGTSFIIRIPVRGE
ncbi:MAG: ATP-binding protein, partial [Thermodesulfovibrionales bacterium]